MIRILLFKLKQDLSISPGTVLVYIVSQCNVQFYKPLDHMNNLLTQIDEEKSAKKKVEK